MAACNGVGDRVKIESFIDILACPETGKDLVWQGKELCSPATGRVFPQTQKISWLFRAPEAALHEWRTRYDYHQASLGRESEKLLAELKQGDFTELTRTRLRKQQQAVVEHAKALEKLLQPLVKSEPASVAAHIAMKTKLPETQMLMSYYNNIFRDWCWGDKENEQSLELVQSLMAQKPKDVLVLGAGGCRLAVDIHQKCQPERTLALDINPFLMLAAAKIIGGQNLTLYEFPIAPLDHDSFAIKRTLSWQGPLRSGFAMLFADGLNPPIKPASFDTIVTPWFLDIVPQDSKGLLQTINYLLKPSGQWINFGSLAYNHSEFSRCYSRSELLELTEQSGFSVHAQRHVDLPYLQSPASAQKRHENVFGLSASKTKELASKKEHYEFLPEYLRSDDCPIPKLTNIEDMAVANRLLADIFSAIDGQKSLKQVATLVADKISVDHEQANAMVRKLLTRYYEEGRLGQQF